MKIIVLQENLARGLGIVSRAVSPRGTLPVLANILTASGFDLPGVPWALYITDSGISIHETYWRNDYGRPRSHGCINISPTASRWLYRWPLPSVESKKQFVFDRAAGTRADIVK